MTPSVLDKELHAPKLTRGLSVPTGKQYTSRKQEAQLMLTTGSTRLAVSRGQQTWYYSTCYM